MTELNNDIVEFTRIFNEYSPRFVRFAYRYIRDMSISEDIVMESFGHWWENRGKQKEKISNVPAYILTSVKNKCLNHIRNTRRRAKIEQEIVDRNERFLKISQISLEACDPQELLSAEVQEMFEKALDSLPRHTREIFTRSRIMNQSYGEIAAELGVTKKHVEFEMSKALKAMRRLLLSEYGPAVVLLYLHMFY